MSYSLITLTKKEHIAFLTLNLPGSDNIINRQVSQELEDACQEINQDDDVYVVVLTGAGKTFCGGSEFERWAQSGSRSEPPPETGTANTIAGIDRPVIAAINGDALGEGLEIALSCDIRLAADNARFGLPHVASGLIPMDGGTQRLSRLIGKGKALEMILTAETIDSTEALKIGLISKVVPGKDLAAGAEALAQNISTKAPISLRYVKEAVNKGLDMTLEQGLRLEGDLYFLLHTTTDRTEGIRAFLEKRKTQFEGK